MVVDKDYLNRQYDIVIIGGGIIGICCAYYAHQKWPKKKIAVLEKKLIGKGVTAYSAYLDLPYGVTGFKQQLTIRSQFLFKELLKKYSGLPIVSTQFIGITTIDNLQTVTANLTSPGACTGIREEYKKYVPDGFHLEEGHAYFHNLNACYAHGDVTYVLAAELAKEINVTLYEGTTVENIAGNADSGYVLSTGYGTVISSTAIIDATGPWMNTGLSAMYIVPQKLRVKKIVALHIDVVPPENAPVIYSFRDDAFFLPQPHLSRWLFSYRCEDWDVDIRKDDFKITPGNLSDAMDVMKRYNFSMPGKMIGGRAHCDLYSVNGDPVILNPKPGYVVVGAPGGSGFRLAPALAENAISRLYLY